MEDCTNHCKCMDANAMQIELKHGPSFCCRPVSRKIITSSLLTLTGWVPVARQMICQTISIVPSSGTAQKKSQRLVYAFKNVLTDSILSLYSVFQC